jgi:hypothetical protein
MRVCQFRHDLELQLFTRTGSNTFLKLVRLPVRVTLCERTCRVGSRSAPLRGLNRLGAMPCLLSILIANRIRIPYKILKKRQQHYMRGESGILLTCFLL